MKNDWYVGAARRKMDGIAMAEPIIVWGRVKRHMTRGKGGVDDEDDVFPTSSSEEVGSTGKSSSPSAPTDKAETCERFFRRVP